MGERQDVADFFARHRRIVFVGECDASLSVAAAEMVMQRGTSNDRLSWIITDKVWPADDSAAGEALKSNRCTLERFGVKFF